MLLEDKVRLKADEYIQAMSVLTFPFVYWQDIDPNIVAFTSTYCEFLTGVYGANRFKRLYDRDYLKIFKNQDKNTIAFDNGMATVSKSSKGKGRSKDRYPKKDDDDKKRKVELNTPSVDNVIQPITLKVSTKNEIFFITIQALLSKLKFDFTDTLIRDIKISGSGPINMISRMIMKTIRKTMNISIHELIKTHPQVFDKSVGTEVFSKSGFGAALPDVMKTTYCLIDLSELPPEMEEKVFDRDVLTNLVSLGWAGFVFYIPEKSRLVFISRRLTFEHVGGSKKVSPADFDIRFVNLNMLRSFSNMAERSQYFTKDQLDKIMSNVPAMGFKRGLSIAKKLVQK